VKISRPTSRQSACSPIRLRAGDREVFSQVLASSKPICGHFKERQLEFLFPEHASEIGSGALLPLGQNASFGVLAICSRDPQRFHPGMGTIFLRQLGEIVSRILVPHIAKL
jgi:uncharacterized protein YigA (DUF484 family)